MQSELLSRVFENCRRQFLMHNDWSNERFPPITLWDSYFGENGHLAKKPTMGMTKFDYFCRSSASH